MFSVDIFTLKLKGNVPVDLKSVLYCSHVKSPIIRTLIEEFALAQVGPAREQVEEDGSYEWVTKPEETLL